jgi:hypothetical protein
MRNLATTATVAVLLAGCAGEAKENDGWNMARVEAEIGGGTALYLVPPGEPDTFPPGPDGKELKVVKPGSGARVVPGSLVTVQVEGLDPEEGHELTKQEVTLLVPPPLNITNYDSETQFRGIGCDACSAMAKSRGVSMGQDTAKPLLLHEPGQAPLPPRWAYLMRQGGTYDYPDIGSLKLVSVNESRDRPWDLARVIDGKQAVMVPRARLTILKTCEADLRHVKFRYLRWSGKPFLSIPQGFRSVNWYELRGCKS